MALLKTKKEKADWSRNGNGLNRLPANFFKRYAWLSEQQGLGDEHPNKMFFPIPMKMYEGVLFQFRYWIADKRLSTRLSRFRMEC